MHPILETKLLPSKRPWNLRSYFAQSTCFLAFLWVVIWLAHILLVVQTSLGNIMAQWVLGLLSNLAAQTTLPLVSLLLTPVISSYLWADSIGILALGWLGRVGNALLTPEECLAPHQRQQCYQTPESHGCSSVRWVMMLHMMWSVFIGTQQVFWVVISQDSSPQSPFSSSIRRSVVITNK